MKQELAKFQIGDLLPIGITILVLGIALAYGLQVMGDIKDESGIADCANYPPAPGYTTHVASTGLCTNGSASLTPVSPAYNATSKGIEGVAKIPDRLPMIVTVILAAVIIGIVVVYLAGRAMR